MVHKIVQTGLVLSAMLLIPGALKDVVDPPYWVKAAIVIPGCAGLAMAFVGLLVLVWA